MQTCIHTYILKKTYSEITKLVLKDIETLSQSHMIHTHALIYVHARTHLTEDNARDFIHLPESDARSSPRKISKPITRVSPVSGRGSLCSAVCPG